MPIWYYDNTRETIKILEPFRLCEIFMGFFFSCKSYTRILTVNFHSRPYKKKIQSIVVFPSSHADLLSSSNSILIILLYHIRSIKYQLKRYVIISVGITNNNNSRIISTHFLYLYISTGKIHWRFGFWPIAILEHHGRRSFCSIYYTRGYIPGLLTKLLWCIVRVWRRTLTLAAISRDELSQIRTFISIIYIYIHYICIGTHFAHEFIILCFT